MHVDEATIDLYRYRRLSQGHALPDNDGTDVLDRYEEALCLWPSASEPLPEWDTPWAVNLRAALQREHVDLMLAYQKLRLERGECAVAVRALSALATEHPLDERVAALLIRALDAAGRRAQALEEYEAVRRRLSDQLGADPGRQLQKLHLRLLDDEGVGHEGEAPAPVVNRLPAPPPHFVARTEALSVLDERLYSAGGEPITIEGPGGIGKTALALRWAHMHDDDFPDGHLFLDLQGYQPSAEPLTPDTALCIALEMLGQAPSTIPKQRDSRAGLYRALLAQRRALVVLDNARDGVQVEPLIPGPFPGLLLVTSRQQLTSLVTLHGARSLRLNGLDEASGSQLLSRFVGRVAVDAEPAATQELLRQCAGLPLAVAALGARATASDLSLSQLVSDLNSGANRLDVLSGETPTDLRAVIRTTYQTLNDEIARAFRLLAVHLGPAVSLHAASSILDRPVGDTYRMMSDLVRRHLVIEPVPRRYAFHDLIREFAQELTEDEPERLAALTRGLDHYTHSAHAAAMAFYPHRDPISLPVPDCVPGVLVVRPDDAKEASEWLHRERQTLRTMITGQKETGLAVRRCTLAWIISDFLDRQCLWDDLEATQRAALELATGSDDRVCLAYAHSGVARAAVRSGDLTAARNNLDKALQLFDQLHDRLGQARTHRNLAWVLEAVGAYQQALYHAQRTMSLHRDLGRTEHHAGDLNAVGWCHALLGDYTRALSLCRQALTHNRRTDNPRTDAAAWDSIGYAHSKLGNYADAIQAYQNGLASQRRLDDQYEEAHTLLRLHDTYRAAGDHVAAAATWSDASTLVRGLRLPPGTELERLSD